VLIRNPKWWGTPAILDQVDVNVAPDVQTWTSALADNNQAVVQPTGFDMSALQAVTSLPNTESQIKPSLTTLDLEFNVSSPITSHPAVREAIAHAVDRTSLITHIFGSVDAGLTADQDHLAAQSQSQYTSSSAAGEYATVDLDATDHLLKSLGYHRDAFGNYVDAQDKPLTLRMAVELGDPWISQVAAQIATQLRDAGIAVATVPADGVSGLSALAASDSYDMALVTRVASPYLTATADWYSETQGGIGAEDQEDWSQFDDPQVDQLFSQAAQALDPVTGAADYDEIDDQLWDQMVALPLFEEPGLLASGVQITGMLYNPSEDGILWNVPLWNTLKPGPSQAGT
jgi:peptide/nickel transport system substrate-binding protein